MKRVPMALIVKFRGELIRELAIRYQAYLSGISPQAGLSEPWDIDTFVQVKDNVSDYHYTHDELKESVTVEQLLACIAHCEPLQCSGKAQEIKERLEKL